MDEHIYYELLEYLKGKRKEEPTAQYKQWADQFEEKNNYIYYGE